MEVVRKILPWLCVLAGVAIIVTGALLGGPVVLKAMSAPVISCSAQPLAPTHDIKVVGTQRYVRINIAARYSLGYGQTFAGTYGRTFDYTDKRQLGTTKPMLKDPHVWVPYGHAVGIETLVKTTFGDGAWCGDDSYVSTVACTGVSVTMTRDFVTATVKSATVPFKKYRGMTADFDEDHNYLGRPPEQPHTVTLKRLDNLPVDVQVLAVMTDGSHYVCGDESLSATM